MSWYLFSELNLSLRSSVQPLNDTRGPALGLGQTRALGGHLTYKVMLCKNVNVRKCHELCCVHHLRDRMYLFKAKV